MEEDIGFIFHTVSYSILKRKEEEKQMKMLLKSMKQ